MPGCSPPPTTWRSMPRRCSNGGVGPNGRRVLSPLAVRAMIDAGRDAARTSAGGWAGTFRPVTARPRGGAVRPDQLRPHRVHRHEPLDRSRDRDLRGHPDQPAPSRRPRGLADVPAVRGRHPGRGGDRRRVRAASRAESRRVQAPARLHRPSPDRPARHGPSLTRDRAAIRWTAGSTSWSRKASGRCANKQVGLVTNHTGRTRGGASTIDVLFRAPGVKLVKLFSPEHGIRGEVDAAVSDSKDEATGLPIVSLYGKEPQAPAAETSRGSTSWSTTSRTSGRGSTPTSPRSAWSSRRPRRADKDVLVLDRPNPIGGLDGRRAGAGRGVRLVHRLPCRCRSGTG